MATLINATTSSQIKVIREILQTTGWIDKRTALAACDCERLGARIWDIRHDPDDPLNIETVRVTKKNRFGHAETHAVYKLVREGATT